MFLIMVAVMLNSSALFYMGTAIIATIGASRLQAWLSVKGLKFERVTPERAQVGELVTAELIVWSDRRIRRPLITVTDILPPRLVHSDRSRSLPIAPAYDVPIRTQYRFRPLKRGRFKWSSLEVTGTDALGLVSMVRNYSTADAAEILVVPNPRPLDIDLPAASGWGTSETEHGQARGAGIEPRGVREYVSGDSLRYVHWRSSARRGHLLVKEFETGSHATIGFAIQHGRGTEIGNGANTTLERICSHAAYLSEQLLRNGALVVVAGEEGAKHSGAPHERQQQVLAALAEIEIDDSVVSSDLLEVIRQVPRGGLVYIMVSMADEQLPGVISQASGLGISVAMLVYDPIDYLEEGRRGIALGGLQLSSRPRRHVLNGTPATDGKFVADCEAAGATVVMVPYGEPQ